MPVERRVESRADFDGFLDVLNDRDRVPIVAASIAEGSTTTSVPLDQLHSALSDAAIIYVLSPQSTFWLTDVVGKTCSVYSGWARVYPARQDWRKVPSKAPLLPARADKRRWVAAIVDAVLEAAYSDGYRPPVVADEARVEETAIVTGVLFPTQVLVQLDRAQAIMRTQQLWPGIPADRLVLPGQTFNGTRVAGNLVDDFIPSRPADDPSARALEFVGEAGTATLARVDRVAGDRVRLMLHPEVAVDVEVEGGRASDLVAVGEVVAIEVIVVEGSLVCAFSDEQPATSMSVLPGGPPWLTLHPAPAPAPASAQPTGEAPQLAPAVAEPEAPSEDVSPLVSLFEDEIDRLDRKVEALEEENRRLRTQLRAHSRLSVPVVYRDPERQLRFELDLRYLTRVAESDRSRYPWPAQFSFGEGFARSVDQLVAAGGLKRDKIIDVCVEVLCGLARDLPVRAVKEWRVSKQGQPMQREDGAVAMRVRLQTGAPAARRLRYWRLPTGEIELDWVGVHDDGLR